MAEMEHLIDDAILAEYAVIGTPAQCGRALCERFAPVVDRMTPTSMTPLDRGLRERLAAAVRKDGGKRRAPVVDAEGHQN